VAQAFGPGRAPPGVSRAEALRYVWRGTVSSDAGVARRPASGRIELQLDEPRDGDESRAPSSQALECVDAGDVCRHEVFEIELKGVRAGTHAEQLRHVRETQATRHSYDAPVGFLDDTNPAVHARLKWQDRSQSRPRHNIDISARLSPEPGSIEPGTPGRSQPAVIGVSPAGSDRGGKGLCAAALYITKPRR
jgi:hypothetical protein